MQKRSLREQNSQALKIASRGVFESEWYDSLGPVSACTDFDESGVNAKSDTRDEGSQDEDTRGKVRPSKDCDGLSHEPVLSPVSPVSPVSPAMTTKKCSDYDERVEKRGYEGGSALKGKLASADSEGLFRRISVKAGSLRLVQSMVGRVSRDRVAGRGYGEENDGDEIRNSIGPELRSANGKDQTAQSRSACSPTWRTEVSLRMGSAIHRVIRTSGMLSPNGIGGNGGSFKVGIYDCDCDADTLIATTSALLEREFYAVVRVRRFREVRMRMPVTVASRMVLINLVLVTDSRGEGLARLTIRRNVCDSFQGHNAEFERFCDNVYARLRMMHRNVVRPNCTDCKDRSNAHF